MLELVYCSKGRNDYHLVAQSQGYSQVSIPFIKNPGGYLEPLRMECPDSSRPTATTPNDMNVVGLGTFSSDKGVNDQSITYDIAIDKRLDTKGSFDILRRHYKLGWSFCHYPAATQ